MSDMATTYYHLRAVSSPAEAAIKRCNKSWLAISYLFWVGSTFVLKAVHCPLWKIHCESCPRLKRLKLKTLTSSSQNWTPLKELPEITNEWTILYIFSTWLTCNKNQIPRKTLWCIIFLVVYFGLQFQNSFCLTHFVQWWWPKAHPHEIWDDQDESSWYPWLGWKANFEGKVSWVVVESTAQHKRENIPHRLRLENSFSCGWANPTIGQGSSNNRYTFGTHF